MIPWTTIFDPPTSTVLLPSTTIPGVITSTTIPGVITSTTIPGVITSTTIPGVPPTTIPGVLPTTIPGVPTSTIVSTPTSVPSIQSESSMSTGDILGIALVSSLIVVLIAFCTIKKMMKNKKKAANMTFEMNE